jgi:hypothetical protein
MGYALRPQLAAWTPRPVTAGLFALLLTLYLCSPFSWDSNIRGQVPTALEPSYFYRGNGRYPMDVVKFSISRDATNKIKRGGAMFLNRRAGFGWRKTPISIEKFRYDSNCDGFWCSHSPVAREAARWIARPGSFVRISTGIPSYVIVINPDERALIFGYEID